MSDQELVCKDCGATFLFTEGEQKFFASNGFTPPKRCKPCRQEKKDRQQAGGARERR
jgi:DNA replicative helicase MCM subunit Mcm2 (Cdc46/Mcm family)